ncbi:MAG TPA: hypothetical protein PL024_10840 [Thauera sp.]|jgi:hypothetical protein|nr:hypothetical protein [Thauera sp.]HRA81986.1 hypothetical protein [Thauera sp.]
MSASRPIGQFGIKHTEGIDRGLVDADLVNKTPGKVGDSNYALGPIDRSGMLLD